MTVADLARDLVAIPSHETERQAGDAIESWLTTHTAATITRDSVGNIIATKGEGGDSLALIGHHDVVPPATDQVTNGEYVVETRDGRLYGRGAADMKGAVAAMLYAFQDATPASELIFASFVGEETGGKGARHAIDQGFTPDRAIIGEGTTNYSTTGVTDVAIAHKGRRGSTITATGQAAHASEPQSGENAIYRACDAIDRIRSLPKPTTTVFGHEMTGTIVITEIDGGTSWNVVPDHCRMTVDERTIPDNRAPLDHVTDLDGLHWEIDQDLPPMHCDDDAFATTIRDAARQAAPDAALVTKPHATDAGWLAAAGTTCVVCGPAEPGEAHTATESVSLDVLDRCYEIYRTATDTA